MEYVCRKPEIERERKLRIVNEFCTSSDTGLPLKNISVSDPLLTSAVVQPMVTKGQVEQHLDRARPRHCKTKYGEVAVQCNAGQDGEMKKEQRS